MPRTVPVRNQKPPKNVQMGEALGLGMTWAGSTALFLYLGSLVDGWLATKPVFTLIGAFVGAAAGFYYLYSRLMAGQRDRDDDEGDREQKL